MTTVLPLVRRELAALSRRRSEYPLRTVGLVILLAAMALVWNDLIRWGGGSFTSQQMARFGRDLLVAFNITVTCLMLIAMPAATAGAIAGEREDRSLDLLRMTPLGPLQIVLSKLAARLASGLQWLVLAAPFLFVPLAFGGVTPAQVLVAVLFPVGAAVWAASAALLASALARRAQTALLATFIGGGAWHALVAIVCLGLMNLDEAAIHLLPVIGYFAVPVDILERVGGRPNAEPFLWMLPLETLLFAAVCVAVAARRVARESEQAAVAEAAPARTKRARAAAAAGRRRIWDRPVAWKEVAAESGSGTRRLLGLGLALYLGGLLLALTDALHDAEAFFAGLAGAAVITLGLAGAARRRWTRPCMTLALSITAAEGIRILLRMQERASVGHMPELMVGTGGILVAAVLVARHRRVLAAGAALLVLALIVPGSHQGIGWGREFITIGSVILAAYLALMAPMLASGAVAGERKRGTLEGLLLTPLTAPQILSGKSLGVWAALGPGLAVLAAHLVLLARLERPEPLGAVMAALLAAAWLGMTIELGLLFSARFRMPLQALLFTIGTILLYVAGLPLLAVLSTAGRGGEGILVFNPVYWFITSLEYRANRMYWGGPVDSATGFFAGYVVFTLACLGLARLFRTLASACLSRAEGTPATPA
jgi:ABC-type transport system involved in multi-copper enzyme maturation permease subunit